MHVQAAMTVTIRYRGQFGHLDEFWPGRRFLVILETPGQFHYVVDWDALLHSSGAAFRAELRSLLCV